MPIVVSHQPDPALLGAAGLAAGYGQYQQRQQDIALEQSNRQADRRMQMLQMQLGDRRDQQRMAMAAYEQQRGRQHDFQMFGLRDEQMANRDAVEMQNRQAMADRQQEQQKELFDYQWSAKQKAELERFNNYEQSIRSSPNLNPQEKERMLMELDGQRAGFRPMAIPKAPEPPTPQEEIDSGKAIGWVTHPVTGAKQAVARDRSGALREIKFEETPEAKAQEQQVKQQTMEYKAQLDNHKLKLDWVKERSTYIRERVTDLVGDVDAEGNKTGGGMDMAKARMQAQQEFDSMVPPPPEFTPPPSPARQQAQQQQPAFGQQGGGLQPVPQGWQAGTNMGPPAPQEQTQIGAQFQQPGNQIGNQQATQQQPAVFAAKLNRQVTMAELEATAQARGISVRELMQKLGIK